MSANPSLFIIIPNYNDVDNISLCINSILKSTYNHYNIIISDDGSNDMILRRLESLYQNHNNIFLLKENRNTGFAATCNRGANFAIKQKADLLFFLNNDTLIDPHCLEYLVAYQINHKAHIVGPKIYRRQTNTLDSVGGYFKKWYIRPHNRGAGEKDQKQFDRIELVDFVSGCALLINKDSFQQLDGFDIKYFMYAEEMDLCFRAKQTKMKIVYLPKAVVWHMHSSTMGNFKMLSSYYMMRNLTYLNWKYGKIYQLLFCVLSIFFRYGFYSLKSFIKTNTTIIIAIFDVFLRRMGKNTHTWIN